MDDTLSPNRALLIKEVKYRCSYRSTLELDVVCRALLPVIDEMDDSEVLAIRDLLLNKEGDLMSWLVEGKTPPEEWALTVALVRHVFKKARNAA